MRIYVINYPHHAGSWIYNGYQKAWSQLGYDVKTIELTETIEQVINKYSKSTEDYIIMTTDSSIRPTDLEVINNSYRTYVYVQPNSFVLPWGSHPNFISQASEDIITALNRADSVYLWTFSANTSFHTKWKHVHTIPLAFDSISYTQAISDQTFQYDVCFVGAWANNGFNEKRKIMIDHFMPFEDSGLRCGIFINKNLTHEQENAVLYNSKVALNIHDAYQRTLGFDTNERTFKSLGTTGVLVSDKVTQIIEMFPHVPVSNDPLEYLEMTKELISNPALENMKRENRENINKNHTYINRIQQMLEME